MSRPHVEVSVGILINEMKEILIAKRPLEKYGGGFWEFPGGKIETDEKVSRALYRELEEELGIKIDLNHTTFLGRTEHIYPEFIFQSHVFIVRYWHGMPQPLERQELVWTQQSQFNHYSFLPGCQKIIDLLNLKTEITETIQNLDSGLVV